MSSSTDKLNNSDAIRSILQKSNDTLHQAIANKDIVVIATQNKADKSKFTIVADSVYEKQLEGVVLTFANPQDYLRLFPTEPGNTEPPQNCPPGTEWDPVTKKCVPIAPEVYAILQIASTPKSQTPQFHENNVLDGKEDTKWAINQKGAALTIDLGSVVDVGTVWIWWGDGDKRAFYFNIGYSQTETEDFKNIWGTDKQSSGKVNDYEPYVVNQKARFIHIVVNGNSVNGDWAAISNLKVTKSVAVESAEEDIVPVTPPTTEPPVEPPVDPNAEPPKPTEGRPQPEKGANKNALTWKSVQMQKQPELWKVVDDKDINVADQFSKQQTADAYITWWRWNQKQTSPPETPPPTTEPPTTPPPTTGNVTKDGVQLLYKPLEITYNHSNNFRDDGKRFDFSVGSNKNYTNAELIGYFRFKDGKSVDDEVSGKQRGGNHTNGSVPKTYDMGVEIKTGKVRYRTEEKHPEYENGTAKNTISTKGIPVAGKFVGYKFITKNAADRKSVNIQVYQDVGDNEGDKPANQWVQIANWDVTTPLWLDPPKDHQETLRVDDPAKKGQKDLEAKWLSCSGF